MDGKAVSVRNFNCPGCGSPLVIRGMHQTESVVCGSCGSIIDVADENLRILSTFLSKVRHTPLIPLGARGVLRGSKWQAIGFMRRCITVEGVGYRWSEYLLFNPYKGFRWLTEYNGHWNFVRQIVDRPRPTGSRAVTYRGTTFRHFQQALAKVEEVLGEFYWTVQTDDSSLVSDFVAPPQMLSSEQTDNEITWSLGEYIQPPEIESAFQLKTRLPAPVGIYANQPSPYATAVSRAVRATAVFLAVAFLIQLAFVALSQNRLVHRQSFLYAPAATEKSVVSDVFDVSGRPSNIVIRSSAPVNNSWVFLNMALINEETGTAYDLGREISYYYGRDEDGNWREGSRDDAVTIPSVPAGRYYLRLEPEGDVGMTYSVAIYRDVPNWTYFFITVGLLLIAPAVTLYRRFSFEARRWAESDHPWASHD